MRVCCGVHPEHALNLIAPLSIMIANLKPGCCSASAITRRVVVFVNVSRDPYQSMIMPSIPRLIMSVIWRWIICRRDDANLRALHALVWRPPPHGRGLQLTGSGANPPPDYRHDQPRN